MLNFISGIWTSLARNKKRLASSSGISSSHLKSHGVDLRFPTFFLWLPISDRRHNLIAPLFHDLFASMSTQNQFDFLDPVKISLH